MLVSFGATFYPIVIPAKAGISVCVAEKPPIPACAGMAEQRKPQAVPKFHIYPDKNKCYFTRGNNEDVMPNPNRKMMIAAYKERKPVRGIFAVICGSTGEAWVGTSRNLATQQNGIWFALRMGSSPFKSLQAAWNAHGEREFRFEELDRLADDFSEMLQKDELKKRQKLWSQRLHASPI